MEALVSFVAQAVRAVVGLLPDWSVPTLPAAGTASSLGSMAAVGNGYFPVALLGGCLVLVLGLKVVLLGWRLIVFVYHQFWGSD